MSAEERAVPWDPSAERTLRAFTEMIPETFRPLAEAAARDESELGASDRGGDAVSAEDVVRAWIRTTPADQRNGLVEVIDSLGFDPELFAEELESVDEPPEDEG